MKTIICACMLLISTAGAGQPARDRQTDIMDWIMEKITSYGAPRKDYSREENEILYPANMLTEIKGDVLTPNGIINCYGTYYEKDRQACLTYFALTDILCAKETSLYDEKAIELHLLQPRVVSVIEINGRSDSLKSEYVNPHYKIRLVIKWRGERGLFKKMLDNFKELAEINKKQKRLYFMHDREGDSFYEY